MARGGKRVGAGRPFGTGCGEGLGTRRSRHSSEITKSQIDAIPDLVNILSYWAERCEDSPRYYYLRQMIDELLATGIDRDYDPR